MTTPGDGGPPDKGKNAERGTLGKYVKRMSTVFKREKSNKNVPVLAQEAPSTSKAEQRPSKPTEEVAKQDNTKPQVIPVTPITPGVSAPPTPTTRDTDRNAMQQERARALFAKYGLTLESHEWIAAKPAVERVEKSIRMRVHRSCHRCGTLYGSDKVCRQCEHKRCKKCPRYPKKKTPEEKQAEKEKEGTDQPKRKRMLTIRTRGGDELVYQPTRQRIRRTCHMCETVFVPATATICENCQHVRCTKCTREPAKLNKWPAGYPGDAEPDSETEVEKQLEKFRRTWRKPRMRVRWQCEQCSSLFLNNSPQCPGCGHERCDRCTRSPIKKPEKGEQFDAEVVAAVEAKLRAMEVDDDSSSSAAEAT